MHYLWVIETKQLYQPIFKRLRLVFEIFYDARFVSRPLFFPDFQACTCGVV